MLKTSLERASQGFGWQSTGMEGCCRSSTVMQSNTNSRNLHILFLSCTKLHLLLVRTLIQLGFITIIVNTR